jgi:outer membrane protein assembly factor BamD
MLRRLTIGLLLASSLFLTVGCRNKNVKNPLAALDSKQPDKVLFDRAMDAMKKRKYDVARLSLQTLINTYPDSEYVARAKLAIGDAWLAEGGSAALAQAENEFRDFITFFPNMPEAAEAQLKIAEIHYKQIEKPDRDFTHARRAEDEYRQLLLQYPDSKLAQQARTRLLEVQEVLGDREYRIGRFYFLRQSYAAAIARLKTLTDTYPLYSQSDDALFMLGQAYEKQIDAIRAINTNKQFTEQKKAQLLKIYTDGANDSYSKIITRYPVMPRAPDAKARLLAMDLAVPTPTQEAIDLNKKEEASRSELGRFGKFEKMFSKRPDYSRATDIGEPTLVDPKTTDAPDIIKRTNEVIAGKAENDSKVNADIIKSGDGTAPPENQPVPRSDSGETILPDKADAPKPMPEQVNEAGSSSPSTATTNAADPKTDTAKAADSKSDSSSTDTKKESSSKKKKKKGLGKLNPF